MKKLAAFLLVICSTPMWAAWTLTNHQQTSNSASGTTLAAPAFSVALTNPSLIVVTCQGVGSGSATGLGSVWTPPSDTAGNTYEFAKVEGTSNNHVAGTVLTVWYALNTHTTASNVVTCNFAGGSAFRATVAREFTGGSTNDSPVDVGWMNWNKTSGASGANNLATVCEALTCTPSTNGDLIYAVAACGSGPVTAGTSPNAFTLISNAVIGADEYFVQSTAGAILPTFGDSTSSDNCAMEVIAFAPSGTAAFPLNQNGRDDHATAADGLSLGQGWTLRHAQLHTSDDLDVGTQIESPVLTVNPVVGDWLLCGAAIFPSAINNYDLVCSDTLGNVARGTVTTSGTAVTFSTGIPFSRAGCNGGGCKWNGQTININGSNFTISAVNSFTSITLTASAGTNVTPVPYIGPGPYCSETFDGGYDNQAYCLMSVTTGGADQIITNSAVHNNDFSETVLDIYNTKGIGSVDTAACPVAGCEGVTGTSANPSGVFSQNVTPSTGGELAILMGGAETGSIFATAGNTALLVGTSGAGTDLAASTNTYCGGTLSFCANAAQAIAQTEAGTSTLTMSLTDNTPSDGVGYQTFLFQPGTGTATPPVWVMQP